MSDRRLSVLWCDDIRMELGNKPSLMGVYTGTMVLASLPATLQRLSARVSIETPKENPIQRFALKIIRSDDHVIFETLEVAAQYNTDFQPPPDSKMQIMVMQVQLSPVELPIECKFFKVVAQVDGEEIESSKLFIQVNAQLLQQQVPGSVLTINPIS